LPVGDRPSVAQTTYAEPEALTTAPGRSHTVLLEETASGAASWSALCRPVVLRGLTCVAADTTMFAVALAIGVTLTPAGTGSQYLVWSSCMAGLALILFALRRSYAARPHTQLLENVASGVAVIATAAMAILSLRVVFGGDPSAAAQTAHYWLFATALVGAGRTALLQADTRTRRRGLTGWPTLIVGAGEIGRLTAKRLVEQPEHGLRPIGFLDKEPLDVNGDAPNLPVLGASWDLEQVLTEHDVRHVVVTFSTAPHHVLLGVVRRCRDLGVEVSVVPRLFEVEGERVSVSRLGALPLVTTHFVNPKGWQFRVKYGVERVVAALALIVTLPLLLLAMLSVRLTMGSPAVFRQRRIGSDGREFEMLKLRTMKGRPEEDGEADSDWAAAQLAEDDRPRRNGHLRAVEPGDSLPTVDDRRTALGRLLRHFSLDELPQLWNVVRGEMSLVGPRPERASYVQRFESSVHRYGERHRVKSGITGWAQVNGLRGRTSLSDRVEWDNYYIENWSPWLDIKIILMTFACVLRGEHTESSS
jgi:exopolysaccharide biosynthesis polyprenyl glycosylphosphotransferase